MFFFGTSPPFQLLEQRFDLRPDLGHRRIADHDQGGVVGLEPGPVELDQVLAGQLGDGGLGARAGERGPVGVPRSVDEPGEHPHDHRHGGILLLGDAGELDLLQAAEVRLGEGGVENDVGVDVERRVELVLEGVEPDERDVEVRSGLELGAERIQLLADLERGPLGRALVEHVHGQTGRAREGELVGRRPGVEDEGEARRSG